MGFFGDILSGLGKGFKTVTDPVGTFVTGATQLMGSISSNSNANKQLKLQQQENQKNRDFNASEAEKARQFNSAEAAIARQFNAQQADLLYKRTLEQNEYNSPVQQMQRLKQAGLNPNLAYGSLDSGLQMSGGTNASASPASGPSASSSGSVGTSLPDASLLASICKTMAETNLINKQAEKTEGETEGINLDNTYKPELFNNTLKLGESEYQVNDELAKYYAKNRDKIDKEMEQIQVATNLLSEQLLEVSKRNDLIFNGSNKETYELWKESIIAPFKRAIAEANISQTQALTALEMIQSQIAVNVANAKNAEEEAKERKRLNVINDFIYFYRGTPNAALRAMRESFFRDNKSGRIQLELLRKANEMYHGQVISDIVVGAANAVGNILGGIGSFRKSGYTPPTSFGSYTSSYTRY